MCPGIISVPICLNLEFLVRNESWPACPRAPLPNSGRGLSGRRRDGADDHEEVFGGDCDVRVRQVFWA